VLLRYAGLFFGTVVTLASLGYMLDEIFRFVLRLPFGPYWPAALAYLPVALITWLACAGGIRHDVALGGESARTGAIRRLVRYTVAALALAAFWFGLAEFARLILLALMGVRPADLAATAREWERFARAAAAVFICAPAWWGHWWSQQVRARAAGPAGQVERASLVRRFYLYAIVLIGACVALAALGFMAFLLLNRQAAGETAVRAGTATAGAVAGVALLWTFAHLLTLRGDRRWQLADSRWRMADGNPQTVALQPAGTAVPATGPQAAAVAGPRRFQRDTLPSPEDALRAREAAERRARAALAVIDGADGIMGAALLMALRKALPDAVLWPVGLNAAAQVAMLNALDDRTPPAVPGDALSQATAILGPSDILLAGGLSDEVTPDLIAALTASPARLLLLPPRDPRLRWVAAPDWPLERWVENAVIEATNAIQALPAGLGT
jgi:hypothetical protein